VKSRVTLDGNYLRRQKGSRQNWVRFAENTFGRERYRMGARIQEFFAHNVLTHLVVSVSQRMSRVANL